MVEFLHIIFYHSSLSFHLTWLDSVNTYCTLQFQLNLTWCAATVPLWAGRCRSMWWVQQALVWLALGAAVTVALNYFLMFRSPPPATNLSHQQSPSSPALEHRVFHQQVYLRGEVYALRDRWVQVSCGPSCSLRSRQYCTAPSLTSD